MIQGRKKARARRTVAGVLAGLGLAMLVSMPSACAEIAISDATQLGSLSSAELSRLCDEIRSDAAPQELLSCEQNENWEVLWANPAQCEQMASAACGATAGDLRACMRETIDDPCDVGAERAIACAPLHQAGCGSPAPWISDCPELPASLADFEGIFEILSHTRNDQGCAAEGESVLTPNVREYFVVVTIMLDGSPLGSLHSCADLADCRAAADELRQYSVRVSERYPELAGLLVCHAELEGALGYASSREPMACGVQSRDDTLTRTPNGSLRLERRSIGSPGAVDEFGTCVDENRDIATADAELCTTLEVYETRWVSNL